MRGVVLVVQGLLNRSRELLKGSKEMVGTGQLFEMAPEAFDRIEFRTILGQPVNDEAVLQVS